MFLLHIQYQVLLDDWIPVLFGEIERLVKQSFRWMQIWSKNAETDYINL